jgi:hypothetical protein
MENYKIDFTTKTLTITKAFADKSEDPANKEYELLIKFQKDFPDLKIVRRTHKTPKNYTSKSGEKTKCNQYKNLTYKNMKLFINAIPNKDSKEKILEAYNFLRNIAGSIQTSAYKTVREWFIEQFPEYRKNPLFYLTNDIKVIDFKPFIKQQEKDDAS